MTYTRLSGNGAVFGWFREGKITVGGLLPDTDYQLICERDRFPVHTDAGGAWSGQLLHDVPLCVAVGDKPVLWDENRINAASASALLAPRAQKPAEEIKDEPARAETPEAIPAREADSVAEADAAAEADVAVEADPVQYREPSRNPPVDALPALEWPRAAAQIKPYFETRLPVKLFDAPGWRVVKAHEAGMDCCFGYQTKEDRVNEVLYGVRARGSLMPPKGLQGYRYERALDGSGYWVLRQRV